jgi:hypothetical protein
MRVVFMYHHMYIISSARTVAEMLHLDAWNIVVEGCMKTLTVLSPTAIYVLPVCFATRFV